MDEEQEVECKLCDITAPPDKMHKIEGEWYCQIHYILGENRKHRTNA